MKTTSKWRLNQNEDNTKKKNKILNYYLLSYQTKPNKPFLTSQTYQSIPTKPNLPNQTYKTKPTIPRPLPNQNFLTSYRSLRKQIKEICNKSLAKSLPWAWHSSAPACLLLKIQKYSWYSSFSPVGHIAPPSLYVF